MGYWTWTDARYEHPKMKKDGWGYYRNQIIGYDGFAKIVCPDDTEICENCYDGYGMFGSYDAYDLVAEWNREDIAEIFEKKKKEDSWGASLYDIAILFANGVSDEEITEYVIKTRKEGTYLITDWKRNIGIAIACEEQDNASLRYPLKVTTTKWHRKYSELFPSISTQ